VALPYRATTEDIAMPSMTADGFTAWKVLPDTFLGDGQSRRYRFLLLRDDPAATPASRAAARVTAVAMMEQPLQPRQHRRLHEEVLQGDRENDQGGRAGTGEDPFEQCVWGLGLHGGAEKLYGPACTQRWQLHKFSPPALALRRGRLSRGR
jgi:hypothetical protein